ncbi:MAG TPA: LamG-like jellyroll fold domain-containing protein [Bacteroidia bacterium]|nr:LamG-like jellyroll fold domain-containing protein [Bacteroidia bacterium]
MKKNNLLILFLLIASVSTAQNLKPVAKNLQERKMQRAIFNQTDLFELSAGDLSRSSQISAVVQDASILSFNQKKAQEIISQKPENINFLIPLETGPDIELELYHSDIFSADFSVVTATNSGQSVNYPGGIHYWGIVKGDNNSIAAISIFEDEVMGIISSGDGNLVLGKLKGDAEGNHIIYNDHDLKIPNSTDCFTRNDDGADNQKKLNNSSSKVMQTCIRLYWEVNYDIFLDKGSVTNATNYVTGLFNESAALYANDNIPVMLSQVYVWDVISPYNSTSTSGLLGQFQVFRNSFNGDIGHLLGYAGNGGIAAGFIGLCASNLDDSQCYSGIQSSYSTVPTYSWSVEVVTHEQGHLLGSRHTHACVWNGNNTAIDGCAGFVEGACPLPGNPAGGGTIMSYCHLTSVGINFNNGFGPQPATVILNNFNNASCLTNCTGVGCFAPVNLTSTNVTTTTALLNWDSVPGALSYNIQYRIIGIPSWSSASSPTNSYNASGLTPGSTYEWQVQTVCSSGNSTFTFSATFITVPLSCNAPTGLTTTGISSGSATFNWNAVGGAVSYDIEYREVGTVPWSSGASVINSYTAVGLNASTNYEWHVQTNCAGGGTSSNSIDSVFTTHPPALPVACYPFSGNANDASGNNHHGTVFGPVLAPDRFGNPNSAYLYDGSNDYISLGNYSNIIPSGNDFSMSVWIQANQVKIQTILMINPDNFQDRFNAMAYYSHNGFCSTFWDYGDCTNGGRLQIIGTTFNFSWEHYVYIVNHTQNYMEVYKNGVLQYHLSSSSTLNNRNRELRIGGAFDSNTAPFFFDGRIDDMTIYDQVLSAQEIQTLFSQQIQCLNSVSINENNADNSINLFPTVSHDGKFHLNLGNIKTTIVGKVFNCLGSELESTKYSNANGIIDLNFSRLAKGIYFLQLNYDDITKNYKFMIE